MCPAVTCEIHRPKPFPEEDRGISDAKVTIFLSSLTYFILCIGYFTLCQKEALELEFPILPHVIFKELNIYEINQVL